MQSESVVCSYVKKHDDSVAYCNRCGNVMINDDSGPKYLTGVECVSNRYTERRRTAKLMCDDDNESLRFVDLLLHCACCNNCIIISWSC